MPFDEECKALVRYLQTDGHFGREPDWYLVLRAARYCGVAPWEMEAQPAWMARALAAEDAEQEAARKRAKSIARRARKAA